MIPGKSLFFGILASFALNLSCSSGNSNDDSRTCVPGQSIQCGGLSGCVGAQSCKADGSGYDACYCAGQGGAGSQLNAGGTHSNTSSYGLGTGGYRPGNTTGGVTNTFATGGSGSTLTTAVGGTGASTTAATSCTPKSMTGYAYPSYVPARRIAKSCTEQAIQQYFADCYSGANCTAFQTGGAQAQCGACLAPTDMSAAAYGPLLKAGPASAYYYETNIAGCEELVGEVNCAPKMQVEFLCEYLSCLDACTTATFNATFQCMDAARTSQCSQQQAAAACLTSSASVAACSGSTFEAQFIAIAKVFCL